MRLTATGAWVIGIGFLLASEAYLAFTRQPLLSDAVWGCEGTTPIVPFALGFCAGHFVWQSGKFMQLIEDAQVKAESKSGN